MLHPDRPTTASFQVCLGTKIWRKVCRSESNVLRLHKDGFTEVYLRHLLYPLLTIQTRRPFCADFAQGRLSPSSFLLFVRADGTWTMHQAWVLRGRRANPCRRWTKYQERRWEGSHPHRQFAARSGLLLAGARLDKRYISYYFTTMYMSIIHLLFQLFNSIAILLGFGMLSEPLAFSYAGWVGGTMLIISYGLITCYSYGFFACRIFALYLTLTFHSAKILAHIMLEDPSIRTYADIGNKAFGHRSRFLTSALFCLELFAVR